MKCLLASRAFVAALIFVLAPLIASAHHSRAEFRGETVEMEGEWVEIQWRNPHPIMMIKVVNDAGGEELWEVQAWGAANLMDRLGVTGDLFKVGERATIAGQVSVRRERYFQATHALLANGMEAVLQPMLMPRWSQEQFVGNRALTTPMVTESAAEQARREATGIFRVWTADGRTPRTGPLPLTESALAAQAAYNPATDNPILTCGREGMPEAMGTPHPIEFVRDGDNIGLRIEEFDEYRTIHMTIDANPESQPASFLGYSVGRWEGSTLVVTTSRINSPLSFAPGVPQSEAVEIVERFTVSDDEQTMDWQATLNDPASFTEPVLLTRTHWKWVPGEEIKPYDCAMIGDARFLE